jgi:hypothetical protein
VSTPDFEELIGAAELDPDERSMLLGAHEALLAAGPPAELPPRLARAPRPAAAVVSLPSGRRRSMLLLAAAIALVAFTFGTAVGHRNGQAFAASWKKEMHGTPVAPHATALISGSKANRSGNWTMLLQTAGLPRLQGKQYYILWLTKHGKPVVQCGSFVVGSGVTAERFAEPYEVKEFDGWVVTLWRGPSSKPGPVLLRTPQI